MPKKVDHEARKERILHTALAVFAKEGYRDANLSLIAAECGISRPTIYQYFRNKEDIYYYAVKLVTGRMFTKYASVAWSTGKGYLERLNYICQDVLDTASKSEGELTNLVDVMLQMKREGKDFSQIVLRRTAKLAILFKRLLRAGVQEQEIRECDPDQVSEHLMLMLESACLQVAFLDTYDMQLSRDLLTTYLNCLKA
ncbi:MAG TPA: TetR/AcrR family transcriptional regulator [Sphaerochaeta sp.]|nr:TetR/AcrR family transcriptional regulator [Sphaerochaeta sp.]